MNYISIPDVREARRSLRREKSQWQRAALGLLALSTAVNAAQCAAIQAEIDRYNTDSVRADKFIELVTRHTEFTEFSASLLNEFVEKTLRAIKAAQDATPPKAGTGRSEHMGTHTITSKLKAHWATDSKPEPMGGALSGGSTFVTILANDLEYASYVDQGHRMDRHFVPGLYINDHSDRLEFDAEYGEAGGGLVVGTKTKYVKGEFMVDKAKEAYEKACLELLDEELERLLQ